MKKLILIVILLLPACGSATFNRVESSRVLVRDRMEVQSDGDWNHFTPARTRNREIWTQHGVTLDLLIFFTGIPDGEPLDDLRQRERKAPKFRSVMTPEDIVGLTESMLAGSGGSFELKTLTPARVSDTPGFRFDFLYSSRDDEVERAGTASGAIVDGRLYLMMYVAPRGHYHEKGLPGAQRLIDSLRIVPPAKKHVRPDHAAASGRPFAA